ncbi:MAG: SPW repeat protein [Gammaproteobacteria bacterium]|nr:MAG: SPW repeat protein [Gammaproteobacteria bacterium]
MKQTQRWQDWLNLLLGAWLLLAPLTGVAGAVDGLAAWNSYVSGLAVALFAIAALYRPQLWEEWLNLAIGIWLIIAPFTLGFTDQTAVTWNQIIVGLIVGGDAVWVMLQTPVQKTAPH